MAGYQWAAAAGCQSVELLSPPRGTIQTDHDVALVWQALPGAREYRVEIESRIPNGRVFARTDVRTMEPRYVPTQRLADERASVKVRITAGCEGDRATVGEMPPWFFMDVRTSCPAPRHLAFTAMPAGIEWDRDASIARAEVSVFSAADGRLLLKDDFVTGNRRDLPHLREAVVVALRHRCRESVSETLYRVVAAPDR